MKMFHTDHETYIYNRLIANVLNTLNITRSLSKKVRPYDNSVAEAMIQVFKIEFANGAPGNLTPVEFKQLNL